MPPAGGRLVAQAAVGPLVVVLVEERREKLLEMCRQIYRPCCRVIYMNTETIAQAPTFDGEGH